MLILIWHSVQFSVLLYLSCFDCIGKKWVALQVIISVQYESTGSQPNGVGVWQAWYMSVSNCYLSADLSEENRIHREPNFILSSILEVLAPLSPTCYSTSDTVVLSCTMRTLLLKIQFYVLLMILFCLLQCGMLYLMCIAHLYSCYCL